MIRSERESTWCARNARALAVLALAAGLAGPVRAQAVFTFPVPPVPAANPLSDEKVLLGMALFFEEQLSSDDTMACATCHLPEAGGGDPNAGARHPGEDQQLGTADDEFGSPGMLFQTSGGSYARHPFFATQRQVTPRNTPSVIGAAFFSSLFWDNRAGPVFRDLSGNIVLPSSAALENQAVAPFTSVVEMAQEGRTWDEISAKLARVRPLDLASDLPARLERFVRNSAGYPPLFERAFGTPDITRERIAMAVASYERTLVPDQSPFDLGTMTATQQDGLDVFQNRGNCTVCHRIDNGLFSDGLQHSISLPDHPRFVKTPSLRNVGLRPRLMSGGQFSDLTEVVAHYQSIGFFLPLAPEERAAVKVFLRSALTDPRVLHAEPPFDRPHLRSERQPPGSNLSREGSPGSGNLVPRLLASAPAVAGSEFRIGVADALGGSLAVLVISRGTSPSGTMVSGIPIHVDPDVALSELMPLSAGGPGEGLGTWREALPLDLALVGQERWFQAFVRDPAATGGFAATGLAHLRVESAFAERVGALAPHGRRAP